MYWPTASTRRIHLGPSGLHTLPPASPQEAAAAHERHASALTETREHQRSVAEQSTSNERPRAPRRTSATPDAPSSSTLAREIAASVAADEREQLVDLARSPDGVYFACLSAHTLSLWTQRPTQVVAAIRRTRASVAEHGRSLRVFWAAASGSEPRRLALQTDRHVLLLYRVLEPREPIYAYIPVLPDSPSLPSGPRRVHSHSRSISFSGLTTPSAPLVSASGERYAPTPQAMTNIFGRTTSEIPHAHSDWWSSTRPPLPKQVTQALDEHSGAARAGSANADLVVVEFSLAMQMDAGLSGCTATEDHVVVATLDPPAIQVIPWPSDNSSSRARKTHTTLLRRMPWLQLHPPLGEELRTKPNGHQPSTSQPNGQADETEPGHITAIEHSPSMGLYVWLSSDGRAHTATMAPDLKPPAWTGHTFHGATPTMVAGSSHTLISTKGKHRASQETTTGSAPMLIQRQATCSSINAPFSLLAIGTRSGMVEVYAYQPGVVAQPSHNMRLPSDYTLGTVTSLAWTSDGYAVAVGYELGWAVFSTYGRLLACSHRDSWNGIHRRFKDDHLFGTTRLFWAMGNNEVVLLARPGASAPGAEPKFDPDAQLYALPFIRSAQATLGDGAMAASSGYGLLHAGDKLVVYRGRELSEWQVIAPDAATAPTSKNSHVEGAAQGQAWQHIRLPPRYLAFNWPIQYAALSQDAGWVAIAGRRGFAISCVSPTAHALAYANTKEADVPGVGQWRMFDLAQISQEQAFTVRGGIGWMGHFVIVATDAGGEAQLRIYDATVPLDNSRLLAMERVPARIVQMRIYPDPEPTPRGASILLYTVTNQLYHVRIAAWGQVVRHAPLFTGDPGTPTPESYPATRLTVRTMGSLSLAGIVSEPTRVRSVGWLVSSHLARSAGVLNKATLALLINGQLMLLRPHTLAQTTSTSQPSQTNGATSGFSSQTDGLSQGSRAVPPPTPPADQNPELPDGNGETKSPPESAPEASIESQAHEPQASATATDTTSAGIPTPGASTSSLAPTASTLQLVLVLASAPGPQGRSLSASTTSLPTAKVQIAYNAQVLADQVELVWTTSTLTGTPKALENTLWAYAESRGLRVWKETGKDVTNAKELIHHDSTSSPSLVKDLPSGSTAGSTTTSTSTTTPVPQQGTILPIDFYPLCLLSARGVVVGMESSLVLRKSLDFGLWRAGTVTHLILPGLLRHTLSAEENPLVTDAVLAAIELARPYATLGYFAHALEVLLHSVLEDAADGGPSPATEAATSTPPTSSHPGTPYHSSFHFTTDASPANGDARKAVLQAARKAQQADQDTRGAEELRRTLQLVLAFPQALGVIANCARKTEASRWAIFFEAAGKPTQLLDRALQRGDTHTAAAYLLVVFNLEPELAEAASVTLVRTAVQQQEFSRALDVLRFLATLKPDDTQLAARIVRQADFLQPLNAAPDSKQLSIAVSDPQQHGEAEIVPSKRIDTPEASNGANGTATPDTTQDVTPRPSVSIAQDEPRAGGIADSYAGEPAAPLVH